MKIEISKNVKRALSMVIAVALLLGTLFTANVGVNIKADAATGTAGEKQILHWDGTNKTEPNTKDEDGNYIIDTAEKLAWIVGQTNASLTRGKNYKVADGIDAIILQKSTINTERLMGCANGEETKAYFDSISRDKWVTTTSTVFAGNFDGNGVEIYGEYAYFYQGGGSGIFGMVAQGVTLKNFAVKNSYLYQASGKAGAIFGGVNATDNGTVTIENVIVSGCYLWAGESNNNYGIMVGSTASGTKIGLTVKNCLVYNNTFYYKDDTTKKCGIVGTMSDIDPDIPSGSTEIEEEELGADNQFENCIILDCAPYSVFDNNNKPLKAVNYKNMYTNGIDPNDNKTWPCLIRNNIWGYTWNNYAGKIISIDSDSVKGSVGKTIMSGFNWATAQTAGNGTSQWYARENDYPTPLMPTGWQDTVKAIPVFTGTAAADFAGGTGTKADPFIIKTPDQLYKMVTSSGKDAEGNQLYYKVADGVDKLYLNNIYLNESLAGIKALVSGGSYKNWEVQSDFYGNFDGNGVTISGMISTDGTGFVYCLSGNSILENINFENCYVKGSSAAVVTTKVGPWQGDVVDDPAISNISVRKSHIESTRTDITLKNNETNGNYYNYSSAGGLVSTTISTDNYFTITNCFFDGYSCELIQDTNTNNLDVRAGIISLHFDTNKIKLSGCVSLGYPVTSEAVGTDGEVINYKRYKSDLSVSADKCYSDVPLNLKNISGNVVIEASAWNVYQAVTNIIRITKPDNGQYTRNDLMYLNWLSAWDLVNVENERIIPMPKVNKFNDELSAYTSYSDMLSKYNGIGLRSGTYPTNKGTYGWYEKLTGSGTGADPYIIDSAEKLAVAIATGGKSVNTNLYYKLGCDIDLGSLPWIDHKPLRDGDYVYTEFSGTLDGDGHTVTGLASMNETSAGLIPILNGGTVKNLHVRNSYASSETAAGILVGTAKGEYNIVGCSVESSSTNGITESVFVGKKEGTLNVKDSYSIVNGVNTYYNNSGIVAEPTVFYPETDAVWYKGASGTARLVNFAKAHTIADVEGNGVIDSYDIKDVVALRNYLLDVDGYAHIYGDVSGNGLTNISDLAIIRREMVDDYRDTKDGFWRNVELGAVKIYYDQNDSQDMARKLELYLESVYPEVDIVKVAGTAVTDTTISEKADYNNLDNANQENAIVITKTFDEETYMDYSVSYDKSKNVLKINGNSFTAVEQAVLDFIKGAHPETSTNPESFSGSILRETNDKKVKKVYDPVTKDTISYYYAWGDEFNEGSTYSSDTWDIRDYKSETIDGVTNDTAAADAGDTLFLNLESPSSGNVKDLWKVEKDGKLHIWRGYNDDVGTWSDSYSWGYKKVNAGAAGTTNDFGSIIDNDDIYIDPGIITTSKSMMFKQGYAEMRASLPSDGHAFPAWWFMNGATVRNNASFDQTLFSKVYKFHKNWDGKTNEMDPTNLGTYKYAVPQAFLEFDIVEFMQAQQGKSGSDFTSHNGYSTGDYSIDYITLTIHKYYDQNAKDGTLYVPKWTDDPTNIKCATGTPKWHVKAQGAFGNTASSGGSYIHKYNQNVSADTSNTSGKTVAPYSNTNSNSNFSASMAANKLSNKAISEEYTYGFSWTVDKSANTYNLTVFVDFNNDGNMASDEIIFMVNQNTGHDDNDADPIYKKYKEGDKSLETAVWNQYAYMMLDNSFYTSNDFGSTGPFSPAENEAGVTLFTDLLSQDKPSKTSSGSKDKATFDVDYVRVYQKDGKRDLVTAETEAFNTGSHFGY